MREQEKERRLSVIPISRESGSSGTSQVSLWKACYLYLKMLSGTLVNTDQKILLS
jgi:hypothetical protein